MFHIHDYLHGPISHYFKNKEMDELYVSIGIKALAQSIIQIFIPIYLYKLGFSISTIALYYIIFFTSNCSPITPVDETSTSFCLH